MLTDEEVTLLRRLIQEVANQHMLLGAHPTTAREGYALKAQQRLDEYIMELKEGAYEF